jgi:hypothetical protein
MIRFCNILLAGMAAAFLGLDQAAAEAKTYRGEYTLSYLGLTVGRLNFDSRVDPESYSIKGTVAAAGMGALFDDTKGTLAASGRFSGEVTRPTRFRADYVSGKKATVVEIGFSGGDVIRTINVPPLKKRRGKGWTPLGADDLKAAADPIAATLIRAPSLDKVCGRRARMFDGELRADLTLKPVSTGTASIKGFSGETVTCSMRFTPVAGYRKGRRSLEFLRTKSRIMVTFAQLGRTGVYAPIRATIGTEIGTITIKARRFEAL